jgi:flagellar hook protein FlgE
VFNPIATSRIELAANLPADATSAPVSTQATAYDAVGRRHTVNLTFTPTAADAWSLSVDVPDSAAPTNRGSVPLLFGTAASATTPGGILGAFGAPTGTVGTSAGGAGNPAELTFTADFGQGVQTMTLSLGAFGQQGGMTQHAKEGSEEDFEVRTNAQDGVPLGAYAGVSMRANGDVAVNYDNGQSRVVARVPLVAFNDPDKLQRLDGQAFMRTVESGEARVTDAASNGVGKLATGSVERSNVDIATEFTKLIVAQRAYTANTRIVTASDEMLQDTLNMRR